MRLPAVHASKLKSSGKRLAIVAGLFLLLFILLNAPYFIKNVRYLLSKHGEVTDEVPEEEIGEQNTLTIPSLSIKAPLVYITEKGEAAYQDGLQRGVVHYPGTAEVGQPGNAYFFGHSSDLPWAKGEYKTVFALLPNIALGDLVEVTDAEGHIFTYKITETKIVRPDDLSVLDQGNNERSIISIQTSYPVGTALKRFIAIGELVSP